MGDCLKLERYGNSKPEAILAILDEKYREKAIRENKKKPTPTNLTELLKKFKQKDKEAKQAQKILNKACEKQGYTTKNTGWSDDRITSIIFNTNVCFTPRKLQEDIQKSVKLASIGQKTEAKKILDKIIKEEKLAE